MKVMAVYIFGKEGLPLLSRFYHERAQKIDGLVGPFLISTSNRMEELTGSNIHEISLEENLHLIMESFADIVCAVVVSEKGDSSLQLNLVARKFYKQFHTSLRKWNGRIDQFESFVPEMEKLLEIESDVVIPKMPSEILDSFVMAQFDRDEQQVLRELIKSTQLTTAQISDLMSSRDRANQLINRLVESNYVGIKNRKSGETLYFVFE